MRISQAKVFGIIAVQRDDAATRYFDFDDAREEGAASDCYNAIAMEGSGDLAQGEEGLYAGIDGREDSENGKRDADVRDDVDCRHHFGLEPGEGG